MKTTVEVPLEAIVESIFSDEDRFVEFLSQMACLAGDSSVDKDGHFEVIGQTANHTVHEYLKGLLGWIEGEGAP